MKPVPVSVDFSNPFHSTVVVDGVKIDAATRVSLDHPDGAAPRLILEWPATVEFPLELEASVQVVLPSVDRSDRQVVLDWLDTIDDMALEQEVLQYMDSSKTTTQVYLAILADWASNAD